MKPGVLYIEALDAETQEPIVLETSAKIPYLIGDLEETLQTYGESFGNQIIRITTYTPQPDPENNRIVLKRVPVAEGQPAAVIKQLQDMCMSKEQLSTEITRVLGQMSRNSGLRAVAITYLVEEGDSVLTGGNTLLFVERGEFTDEEASQLYNSIKAHSEELRDMLEKDGHKIQDQDGPKILQPGDAGFIVPPGKP